MANRSRRLLALLAVVALVVSACGGDDDGGGDEPTDGETTAATDDGDGDGGDTDDGDDGDTDDGDGDAAAPSGEPVVIGMIEDTAGGASAYSLVQSEGIEAAVEEINDNGGILGRPVELLRENDQNEPSQTPTLTRRLIENGAHVLLMNSGSASAVASKPICQEEQIVCLAPGNVSNEIVAEPDADFSYIMAPSATAMGEAYQGGMPAAGIETLAVISDDSPTIQGFDEFFLPFIEEAGIEFVAEETVPLDASDVSAQIARVADADADALLVSSLGGQTEVLIHNTAAQQLPDLPRFTVASIGNQPDSWELADPGALEGVVYIGTVSTENPRTQELEEVLSERVDGFQAVTGYNAQGYDSVQLLKMAIESAGGTDDSAAINTALEGIQDYQPHFGQANFTLSFGPEKHSGSDGPCGIVLGTWGPDNQPAGPWDVFQTSC